MKNTKFRKRALLSSVAMLLVALVALGSATFAWFTANPNAEAHGITMKTTASAGLVIRTETDSRWTHSAVLRATGSGDATVTNSTAFNASPVSQDQNNPDSFWTVIADNSSNYGAKAGESMTAATAGTEYYAEKVYCRLSDGSDASANSTKKVYLKGVTITAATGATMQNCIRVAIAGPSGLLGTYALSTAGQNGQIIGASATSSSTWKNADSTVTTLQTTSTSLNVDTGLTALAATGSDLTKYITVYVYLDGQDSECYSDKVGTVNAAKIIDGIQVDLALV